MSYEARWAALHKSRSRAATLHDEQRLASTLRSRRPGRSSAGSNVSGRFVAMSTCHTESEHAARNAQLCSLVTPLKCGHSCNCTFMHHDKHSSSGLLQDWQTASCQAEDAARPP